MAELLDHGKRGQAASPTSLPPGSGAAVGTGHRWRVGLQGSQEVERDGRCTCLKRHAGSLFNGGGIRLLWGEELLRNSAVVRPWGEPGRRNHSSAPRFRWHWQPRRGDTSLLGIPWSSTGETPSRMHSEKTISMFDQGHNTQKLLGGAKWHRNLPCLLPRGP